MREKGTRRWRKLHDEGLHNLYSSPRNNEDYQVKDKMVEACSTHGKYDIFIQFYSEDLGVRERIILKWVKTKYCIKLCTEVVWLKTG